MTRFRIETHIEAPIELVFGLARDIGFHERSMAATGERAIGGRTSGGIEAGESVTWRARHFGLWWTLTSHITAVEPPVRFADEQLSGPFRQFSHVHTFRAAHGGTLMVDEWEHTSPFGLIGQLVDRLVLGGYMRGLLETRNAALKLEAERLAASYSELTAASAAWTAANNGSPGSTSTSHDAIRSMPDGAPN